ncbi:MAG: hypothetical protein C4554_03625 [Dethiobacter sp.]|jgi:flagellar FliL protein|nr:MAG: hypothetical protein C4554_03625 [Dethiobacter sp.]
MRITDHAPDEKQQKKDTKKEKSKVKAMVFILIIGMALSGGYSAWHFFLRDKQAREKRAAQIITSAPMDFTVNLADAGQRRYLKATVELGYSSKGLTKEIEKNAAEIRDLIIELFRSRTVSEINASEGTNGLRMELKAELNERLKSGEILEIYFTEFIIQ